MKIKHFFSLVVEIATRRRCKKCAYNDGILCKRMDETGDRCRDRYYPVGWEARK